MDSCFRRNGCGWPPRSHCPVKPPLPVRARPTLIPVRGEPVEPYERAGPNVGLPAKLVLVETGSGHPEGGGDGFLLSETIAQPPNAPFDVIPSAARNLRRCAVVMRRFQPQGSSWGMRAFRFLTPLCSVRNDSWSVFSQDGAQSYAKVSFRRNGCGWPPAHIARSSLPCSPRARCTRCAGWYVCGLRGISKALPSSISPTVRIWILG